MENRKRVLFIVLSVVLAMAIGGAGVYFWMNYQSMEKQVEKQKNQENVSAGQASQEEDGESQKIGGQKDEHGCLGAAGYTWCPSTQKCQRMWEEYCEEYKEQFKSVLDDSVSLPENSAPGDAGENPPAETENWPEFISETQHFKFHYPEKYKTVIDNYGWPYAVVHLIDKAGGQSYDVTFEVWDNQQEAEDEGRTGSAIEFFGMSENSQTGKYISITCWNSGTAGDCENIYATLTFQF